MSPTGSEARDVVIVGAGLAGLLVARELRRRDVPVRILEASERTGGKAGALPSTAGDILDHGYHVFPGWYENTRALMDDLGILDNLADIDRVHYLRKGEFPEVRTLHEMSSMGRMWKNLRSGLVPARVAILASYYGLELALQRWSRRGFLDRVSANGFLRSRFYATEEVAETHQHFVLQASSIPNYELSAMTARRITQAWFRVPSPLFSILRTDLQEGFIAPLERDVVGLGAKIDFRKRVERIELRDSAATALVLDDGTRIAGSHFVVATPCEVTRQLVDADIVRAEGVGKDDDEDAKPRRLATLSHLDTAPMAAFHVFLKRRIPLPRQHTVLFGSTHEVSFVDIAQWWSRFGESETVLSCIASDFGPLAELSEDEALRVLVDELHGYMPQAFDPAVDVDWSRSVLWNHLGKPLFINTVGSWHFRPDGRTRIPNLYVAGDYCRSTADLTTMESTVESAHDTARHMLREFQLEADIPHYRLDESLGFLYHAVRWAGLPVVFLIALPNMIKRMLRLE